MKITEAMVTQVLKEANRSLTATSIGYALYRTGNSIDREVPKIRKVLSRMVDKGTVDRVKRGRSYRFSYISPEAQAENQRRTDQRIADNAVIVEILDKAGFNITEIEKILGWSIVRMSFEDFLKFCKNYTKL